ncbi:hypothetical protein AB0I66_24590 [Streptomyces sp. NPDC050439]|uniref:hypothetical protein n=1 Tax=unclassified Streptomyces TaxID=2593676 RepID=UPI0034238106
MPLRTTAAKAVAQIERRDSEGAAQYRAELRYFHYKPRAIIGMTTAYTVVDEVHRWAASCAQAITKVAAVKPEDFSLAPQQAP